MSMGKPSPSPCYVCGGHDGNIIEPVSHNSCCRKHRKYWLKWEKIRNALLEWDQKGDLDGLAKFIDKALKQ